jgi:hypothetical protein
MGLNGPRTPNLMKCQQGVSRYRQGLTFPFFAPEQCTVLLSKEHSAGIRPVCTCKEVPYFQ